MKHGWLLLTLPLACNATGLIKGPNEPSPTPTVIYTTPCASPTPGPAPNVTTSTQCAPPDQLGRRWCCGNADWQTTIADPDNDSDGRLCGWLCAQTAMGPQEVIQTWDFESLDTPGAGAYMYQQLTVTCCAIGE